MQNFKFINPIRKRGSGHMSRKPDRQMDRYIDRQKASWAQLRSTQGKGASNYLSIYIYLYQSISIYIYLYLSISNYVYLLSISIYIYLYRFHKSYNSELLKLVSCSKFSLYQLYQTRKRTIFIKQQIRYKNTKNGNLYLHIYIYLYQTDLAVTHATLTQLTVPHLETK